MDGDDEGVGLGDVVVAVVLVVVVSVMVVVVVVAAVVVVVDVFVWQTSSKLTTETAWPLLGTFMCPTVFHPSSWYSWMASAYSMYSPPMM